VTCLDVRDRLTEFALGVLPEGEAADVERHLEWCTGCRRESMDLQEGVALVGRSLPLRDPPASLEDRVVESLVVPLPGQGRHRRVRVRRSVLTLAAALFGAMIVAIGAVGWAVAEHGRIQTFQETAAQQAAQIDSFRRVIDGLPGGGVRSQAEMRPVLAGDGSGLALISTDPAPNADDWIWVSAIVPSANGKTYTMEVTDRGGRVIAGGPLFAQDAGGYLGYDLTGEDLSKAEYVTVYDGRGQVVLSGRVERASPSP
jgi:Putative zinc-finger